MSWRQGLKLPRGASLTETGSELDGNLASLEPRGPVLGRGDEIAETWARLLARGDLDPRLLILEIHRLVSSPRVAQRLLRRAGWPRGGA